MIVSPNIRRLLDDNAGWSLYRNRSVTVRLQKADPQTVYNVPGRPGVVYNFPEDAYADVDENGAVVIGLLGEMWPVPASVLPKYGVTPDRLGDRPIRSTTRETDEVFCALQVPDETVFTLTVSGSIQTVLTGNRPGIGHGGGDYLLVLAKSENGRYVPDFSRSGRIVNGTIFDRLYKPYHP